jgi:hypothetical protein
MEGGNIKLAKRQWINVGPPGRDFRAESRMERAAGRAGYL